MKSTSSLHEGQYFAEDLQLAIVASRFNEEITLRLLSGAKSCIASHRGKEPYLVWVPGAFEIPLMAKHLAERNPFDAIICIGAVIRGETPHFDYVAGSCAQGIQRVQLDTGVPIIFSVLTTNNLSEALERSAEKESNAGYSGALTAITMAHLLRPSFEESRAT